MLQQIRTQPARQQAFSWMMITRVNRLTGLKGGKPSFKFVSEASSNGNKGKSKFKSSGFLPVVVMGTEEKDVGGAEQMNTPGRRRSVIDRDFGGVE